MARSARFLVALLLLGCACGSVQPLPPAPSPTPTVVTPITFPEDDLSHDDLTEWWYFTGHLNDAAGHQYGFEFTIFQVLRGTIAPTYLAHFAVTDVTGQTFSHQAQVATADSRQTGPLLTVQNWQLDLGGDTDSIQAAMAPGPGVASPVSLDLQLTSQTPPVLHQGGYIDYGPTGGSYYYSRPRLSVAGTLQTADGAPDAVSGIAWMDHQWGNFVLTGQGGWDWYSLQLDDDTEIMLYVLRNASGQTSGFYGTHVLADGSSQEIPPSSVQAEATGSWTSPHTGAVYPSGWVVTLPQLNTQLKLTPQVQDQELYFPGMPSIFSQFTYWEGAVDVQGLAPSSPNGQGYVELTGYAPATPSPSPAPSSPS